MYYFALPVKKSVEVQGQASVGLDKAAHAALAECTHVSDIMQVGNTRGAKPPFDSKVKDPAGKNMRGKAGQIGNGKDATESNENSSLGQVVGWSNGIGGTGWIVGELDTVGNSFAHITGQQLVDRNP